MYFIQFYIYIQNSVEIEFMNILDFRLNFISHI